MELSTSLTLLRQFFSLILSVASEHLIPHCATVSHIYINYSSLFQPFSGASGCHHLVKYSNPRSHGFCCTFFHHKMEIFLMYCASFFKISPQNSYWHIFFFVGTFCIPASIKTIKLCRLEQCVSAQHIFFSYPPMSCCLIKDFKSKKGFF